MVTDGLANAQSAEGLFETLKRVSAKAQSIKVGYASANLAMRGATL